MKHYLFYCLISETDKGGSSPIKMKGPFIHRRPAEIVESDIQRYLLTETDIKNEKRFLAKKHPSEIPIFKEIEVPEELITIEVMCENCNGTYNLTDEFSGKNYKCPICSSIIVVKQINVATIEKHRNCCFINAEKFLNAKYDTMSENYEMCRR